MTTHTPRHSPGDFAIEVGKQFPITFKVLEVSADGYLVEEQTCQHDQVRWGHAEFETATEPFEAMERRERQQAERSADPGRPALLKLAAQINSVAQGFGEEDVVSVRIDDLTLVATLWHEELTADLRAENARLAESLAEMTRCRDNAVRHYEQACAEVGAGDVDGAIANVLSDHGMDVPDIDEAIPKIVAVLRAGLDRLLKAAGIETAATDPRGPRCAAPCPDHDHACDRDPGHLGPHRDVQQKGTETCSWEPAPNSQDLEEKVCADGEPHSEHEWDAYDLTRYYCPGEQS